ncbi:MAG TPA: cell division ATP-binding protein FtsE [Clostridiales bacterium]|nr:cell division ATP-binding protein FtsE [Clostridiales bacterium]
MIRLADVYVEYKNGVRALSGVNMLINSGEFVFLVGPSGAGKSTLVKLLTAEVAPKSGVAFANGFNLMRLKKKDIPALRRTMGVVFQDFRLIDRMSVYENVAFAMRVIGASPWKIRKRVLYVLELVGLSGREENYPRELSGGEQQRVAIARALVNNPQTIIADEPTGNLDPEKSAELMEQLNLINALGTTMIVITHDKQLVDQYNKRVITLDKGVIIGDGVGGYDTWKAETVE